MSSKDAPAPKPALADQLGLFFVSCATLLLQITWTRVLSVSLWYHFAFLVISTAMLGFGFSGVLLTLSKRLSSLPLRRGLLIFSTGQILCTLGGYALANRIPFAPFSLLADSKQLLYAPLYLLCIAAPFVFSGLTAALLLSRRPAHAGRIYFFDLLGAGVGCIAVVLVMPRFGGSGTVIISAALAAAGAAAFASSEEDGERSGWARLISTLAILVLVTASFYGDVLLPLRISKTKRFGPAPVSRLLDSDKNLFTGWNTSSRVDVLPTPWGRAILIDAGTAVTRMPRVDRDPRAMGPITDERRIVLRPGENQRVLIIGSGGGWEVLAALRTGAKQVVAVEINAMINRLVRHGEMAAFVGNIFNDPRVSLHNAEARSFIRRQSQRFDVILASHTISNAAQASGALSLAEEYVLTREAFADYLTHLSPRGRLWLSRPVAQIPRLIATARQALVDAGVRRPADHLIAFAGGPFYGGLVLSRAPMSLTDAREAGRLLRRARLRPLHLPAGLRSEGVVAMILRATPAELETLYREHPTELRPATDNKPFFNQRTRWSDLDLKAVALVFNQRQRGRMALEDQPVAEVVLVVVLLQSTLLALVLVLAPLWWRKREALHGAAGLLSYFLALGLGFILVEIAMIQRFSLFLGRPVHTFALVVGTLLLSSGVGSLLTERLLPDRASLPRRLRQALLLIVAILLVASFALPPLLNAALGLPFFARGLLTAALVAPVGLLLGTAFPVGLRYAGERAPGIIPWAWGLNAVSSVVGSVAAIIIATAWGFSGVFFFAAATYLAAFGLWIKR